MVPVLAIRFDAGGATLLLAVPVSPTACDNPSEPHKSQVVERPMLDLPSGTVTFLFTDVEGSTRFVGEGSGRDAFRS